MNESIGALWVKESRNGKRYFSGKITIGGEDVEIVVFSNDKGDNPKRPDYRIFKSEPRDGAPRSTREDDVPF